VTGSELVVVLAEVSFGRVDSVVVPEGVVVSVEVEEVSGETGPVDVAPSTTEDGVFEMAALLVPDVSIVGAVEVELTKGGAFSMYEPDGWTA
jgi:hypothetical protein